MEVWRDVGVATFVFFIICERSEVWLFCVAECEISLLDMVASR